MNLETNRLLLKSISKEDVDFIYSHFSDEIVTKYLYDEEPLTDMEGAEQIIDMYLKSNAVSLSRWIITRKSDQVNMGTCGFHCWDSSEGVLDVGYDLQQQYWGKGYMQEALKAIINVALIELKIKKINAHIYIENDNSIKLVERLGFKFSGKEYDCNFRGKGYLHKIYSLDCTSL